MHEPPVRLTDLARGAGCGCKLAPAELHQILAGVDISASADLIVGISQFDDAAVYRLNDRHWLVSTVDFFAPIVDDPYLFGRIAAANALSDVYAMGGQPLLALSVMGLPTEKVMPEVGQRILRGASDCCKEANVTLGGGHTIEAPEPFFGLSVQGLVEPARLKSNSGARATDLLYLTKPIGTGLLTTAVKRKKLEPEALTPALESMQQLNSIGRVLSAYDWLHAMTDVTGFGLLGHLVQLCLASGLGAEIVFDAVPLLPGVNTCASAANAPDNTFRNWKHYGSKVSGISAESLIVLCDPQTNGGLLLAVDAAAETQLHDLLRSHKQQFWNIGKLVAHPTGSALVFIR
ncbi:MAG: selenide, water dikinase SelD [Chitinophagales bacterium]|nr:selenide, water dikinase SelD [Chitinophagales bacterium]MDW8428685.1 selenide, water dikinase SelD [Chitinophagales bacterium]